MSAYGSPQRSARGSFNTSNFGAVAAVFVALIVAGLVIGMVFLVNDSNKLSIPERELKNKQELKEQESEQEFLVDVLAQCKMFKGEEKKMDCIEKFTDEE
jgi:hypothetical protein